MSHFGSSLGRSSSRTASLIRRFMRFLRTARPSARGVVNPTRGPAASGLGHRNAVNNELEKRKPWS
jgi:hypothetical protein